MGLKSQITSQKVFIEKELSSYHKHIESINEKISENQNKNEVTDKKIVSAIEKIANEQSALAGQYKHIENIKATNATVATQRDLEDKKIVSVIEKIDNNQIALADQYKHIENIIATNATVAKEKEEQDKKYDVALEGRLTKMENILQTFQEGQIPIEICTTPKQTESEVNEDSITVQKTQVNNAVSSDKPQLEKVSEASTSQSNVSMNTVEMLDTSGKMSIKVSHLKKQKYKLRIAKIKKERKKIIPEEREEQDSPTFMSLLFNF